MSSSAVDAVGSFKTNDAFQNALLTSFSGKLSKSYGTKIANVSFVSRTALANQRYGFTFRVYFLKAISDRSLRTDIVSNIQSGYYDIIRSYFTTINKSAKLPTSATISLPTPINTSSKNTVIVNLGKAVQSTISDSLASLTKMLSATSAKNTKGSFDT